VLLLLANWLSDHIRAFSVVNYITLRAVLATLTSLAIGLQLGPWVIRKLTELKVGQAVRDDGPQTHLIKAGTPTMGGTLILLSIGLTTLLWADLSNRFVWLLLAVTCGTGLIGFVDDYRKVVYLRWCRQKRLGNQPRIGERHLLLQCREYSGVGNHQ